MELQTEEETTVEMSVSVASQDIRLVENLHVTVGFRSLCSEQNLEVFFFCLFFTEMLLNASLLFIYLVIS